MKMLEYIKVQRKRIFMSLFGVLISGVCVGFMKIAAFGVDPFQVLVSGLDYAIPIDFGTLYVLINAVLLLFSLIVLVDASVRERSVGVGLRAVAASFVQLTGYGSGFLRAWWTRCVLGRGEFEAFRKNFYK